MKTPRFRKGLHSKSGLNFLGREERLGGSGLCLWLVSEKSHQCREESGIERRGLAVPSSCPSHRDLSEGLVRSRKRGIAARLMAALGVHAIGCGSSGMWREEMKRVVRFQWGQAPQQRWKGSWVGPCYGISGSGNVEGGD